MAIVKSLGDNGYHECLEEFLGDLSRWQELFRSNAEELAAYRDVMHSMWGVVLDPVTDSRRDRGWLRFWGWAEVVDEEALIRFQHLASSLVSHANEFFDLEVFGNEGLERSQHKWLERTSQTLSINDPPNNTANLRFSEVSSAELWEPVPLRPPDPSLSSNIIPLRERIEVDVSDPVVDPMVTLLIAGAVFAIVIVFLQGTFISSHFPKLYLLI
jgi:hypothetical protein